MLATSLTIGIGGSGGVFAPSLFLGAMLGSAVGQVAGHVAPGSIGPVGAYGLVGMGAVFAAAARAPITAVVILFELTGEYTIILPLMAAIVLATLVSRVLSRDTIYSAKLRRQGVDLDRAHAGPGHRGARVSAVMEPLPPALDSTAGLAEARGRVVQSPYGLLPVTGPDGRYLGVVTAVRLAEALEEPPDAGRPLTVADLLELPTPVDADLPVALAIDSLVGGAGVPVTSAGAVIGWLTSRSVLVLLEPPAEPDQ